MDTACSHADKNVVGNILNICQNQMKNEWHVTSILNSKNVDN